ncbi:MAG: hypothetical protein ACI8XB_002572 [Patiriisocius sp.]
MSLYQNLKNIISSKEPSNELYSDLRQLAEGYVESNPALAIEHLRIAASLAWISNTTRKHDKKLDAVLHSIGSSHLSMNTNLDESGSVVIITSGILEFGGLTQQVENLVKYFPENEKLVVWTTESFSNSNIDSDRGKSISERAEIKKVDTDQNHIYGAKEIVNWVENNKVKAFFYFLSPDDTTAFLLPSMLPGHKHILINVSHHVFCLGSFQFDAIVDVSDHYYHESVVEERSEQLHKIYLSGRGELDDLQKIVKNDIRKDLSIPEEAYLTVTVGNPNKSIWDSDQSYIHIIGKMLMESVDVHHLLIAKGMDKIKDLIVWHYPKVKNRIHVLNGTRDLIPTLKGCDLYLNSFPMGGALSSLDAIAASLAIVAIPAQREWFKISEITALSQDEYLSIIKMFVNDFEFRLEHAATLQEFYRENHQPIRVAEQYMELLEKVHLGNKEYRVQKGFQLNGLKRHVDLGKLKRDVVNPYLELGHSDNKTLNRLIKQLS